MLKFVEQNKYRFSWECWKGHVTSANSLAEYDHSAGNYVNTHKVGTKIMVSDDCCPLEIFGYHS